MNIHVCTHCTSTIKSKTRFVLQAAFVNWQFCLPVQIIVKILFEKINIKFVDDNIGVF